MGRRVAIIGAGTAGLLACKYSLSKGYSPTVFEAKSNIGGVWTNTPETTKLQTPKILYQFSDFAWPDSVTHDFPTQQQVLNYIQAYALHFDLLPQIKFNCKVMSLNYQVATDSEIQAWSLWGGTGDPFSFSSKGKWNLKVQHTQNLSTQEHQFEFVILCVGRFSDVPNIPEFVPGKGPEVFKGKVMHSMDYSNMDNPIAADFIKAKRTVVVGMGKSGMDIAMECSTANGVESPCTMIYRKRHWNLPDLLPWGFPLTHLYLNRFSEVLLHKPEQGFFFCLLATLLSPLRWGISKFVETYIRKKCNLAKYDLVPQHSFLRDLSSCSFAIAPEDFYNRVDEGSIKLVKAQHFDFCNEGILIDGKTEPLESDLVIFCTGFAGVDKIKEIFESSFFQKCISGSDDTPVPMYRECIHPRIPHLAIIGFSESISNLYTSEMRSRWLVELLDGTFKLPSITDMEKNISEWANYMKQYSGEYCRRSSIAALHIWYNDRLCEDMGWNPKRKKGLFSELFEPYGPSDYAHP